MAKELQSVQVCFNSKRGGSVDLDKDGLMWSQTIIVPDSFGEITYQYTFQLKGWFGTTSKAEKLTRKVSSDHVQRDIISKVTSSIQSTGIVNGIIAHVIEILKYSDVTAHFCELISLKTRNSTSNLHWDNAFKMLLEGKITKQMCLLFLQCFQNKIVDSHICLTTSVASSIWQQLQQSDQDLNKMCAMCTEEIFVIFKAANPTSKYLLHFIIQGRSFLDAAAIHKLVRNESPCLCNCSNSFSCLKGAFQFIFTRDADVQLLPEIINIISKIIPGSNYVALLAIVRDITPSDKNKELKDKFEKHILTQVKTTLTEKIKNVLLLSAKEIMLKVGVEMKTELVLHCEKEILYQIKNRRFTENDYITLESLCKEELFFQNMDQKLLLLDALVHNPGKKPKCFIKYVLMNTYTDDSRNAIVILEKAFDEVLKKSTEDDLKEAFNEFDTLSKKTISQAARACYEEKMLSHISKMSTFRLLPIHQAVEKLSETTINVYCHLLKKKLNDESYPAKCKYIEKLGSDINTR